MLPRLLSRIACALLWAPALIAQTDTSATTTNSWPHWRGPDRNGISTEKGWSPAGKAEPLWTAELGVGYSNMSIADGRLFTIGFDDDAQEDVIWCLDPETGEELWSYRFSAQVLANFHGGGSLTTPSIDGERVYVSHRFGRAFCFDAHSGEILWERDYAKELGFRVSFHGCGSSPLVLAETLIMTLSGVTLAADKDTGDVIWRTQDYGDGGYSNPMPFELDDLPVVLAFTGKGLALLDMDTGEELQLHEWSHADGGVNAATPIPIGSKVFISSAYDKGAALIETAGEKPGFEWYARRLRNKVSGCVLWEDHFYGFDESMLKCINMKGEEQWRVRGLGMGTLSMADGKLIILTSRGFLVVGEARPDEFVELSRTQVLEDGVYWTQPVLANGLIYCRNSLGQLTVRDHRGTAAAAGTEPASPDAIAATSTEGPTAASLFEKHVEALGGEAAWREHASMRLDGDIEITGAGITRTPMTMSSAAPASWHLHYSLGRYGDVYRGYDGEIAWQLDDFYGNKILKEEALREIRDVRRFHAALDWRAIYAELENVGREDYGGGPCWKVAATSNSGAKRFLYFDAKSGLLIGRTGEKEAQITYADHKQFDGLILPTRITALLPDTGEEETYFIASVTFDEVDASVFERPEEVTKLLWTPADIAAADAAAREKYADYLGAYVANFGPFEDAEVPITVERGELMFTFPNRPAAPLVGPDQEGWFSTPGGGNFGARFEEVEDGEGTVLHLRLQSGDQRLPRKKSED